LRSAMLDAMPAMVRAPVVVVKPGLLSAAGDAANEIAPTDMVPTVPIAGAPFAADDNAESITKPLVVVVITLNTPAA